MKKGTLTPFDNDLIAMIENIIKKNVNVFFEEGYIRLEACVYGVSVNELYALEGAVKGRTAKRFINFEIENAILNIRFDSEEHQYPDQLKFDLQKPENLPGLSYARKLKEVDAILFKRDDIERLVLFTGGGLLTIPREFSSPATYEFPTENGTLIVLKEGEYILKEKGHFFKMSKSDFEFDFESKN